MLRNSTRNIPAAVRRRVPSVSSQTGTRGIRAKMASAYNTPAVTPLPPTVLFQSLSFSPNQLFLPSHVPTSNVSRPQTETRTTNPTILRKEADRNRTVQLQTEFFLILEGGTPNVVQQAAKKKSSSDSGVRVVRSSGGVAPNPLLLARQTLPVAVWPVLTPGFYELIYQLLEQSSTGQEASTKF